MGRPQCRSNLSQQRTQRHIRPLQPYCHRRKVLLLERVHLHKSVTGHSLKRYRTSEQTEGSAVVHVQPVSIAHTLSHPSPLAVFPSSQACVPVLSPSPQGSPHTEGLATVHDQPASTTHRLSQPSPVAVFPSSQTSVPSKRPSPQIAVHTVGEFVSHVQPVSTTHTLSQPSPFAVFPSSHARIAK